MQKFKKSEIYLRTLAIVVLLAVIGLFAILALFTTNQLHGVSPYMAIQGEVIIPDDRLLDFPGYLNGQWEFFEQVCDTKEDVLQLGTSTEYTKFPISTITQAVKNGTYRLRFRLEQKMGEQLYLYIPTYQGNSVMFLNGLKLQMHDENVQWVDLSEMHTFHPVIAQNSKDGWHELILSGHFSEETNTLYKRPVIIGTQKNIMALAMFDSSNQLLLGGIFILVFINGFVFMVFRPNHKLISMITVFDTLIMGRVFFSMNYFGSFIKNILPGANVPDSLSVSGILLVLMLAGLTGCILATMLFDPEKKAPKWVYLPAPVAYIIYMFIFPFNLEFFEKFGSKMLVITYIITFIGVFWQFTICWKETKKRGYYLFQFIKTSYLGCIVFYDITNFTNYINYFLLFYLYAIFFILHVVVRLYDNNESYGHVELVNRNLETIVEERTLELSKANKILSELSIRDPLTTAFNRLYFESQLESAMEDFESKKNPVFLCIFDLDFFKKVNDTYGHIEGDEQLKETADTVRNVIDDAAVFARIGGEEFILLFVGKEKEEVMGHIERLRLEIEKSAKANKKRTTASFGVATLHGGETSKQLMKNADVALYKAKDKGRNQTVIMP